MIEIYFKFPDTPNTVLGEMLRHESEGGWNVSWSSFYNIYHNIIIIMARNTFLKFNFKSYTEEDLKEVLCEVFFNLQKIFLGNKYVFENHRFRGFLKKVVVCRTMDYIRKKYPKHVIKMESLDFMDALVETESNAYLKTNQFEQFEEDEERAYKLIKIYNIWDKIKNSYDENNAMIFEMVYLQNKTIKEACEEFGISRSAVDKSLSRIMKRIKKEYAKLDEGGKANE